MFIETLIVKVIGFAVLALVVNIVFKGCKSVNRKASGKRNLTSN
jgi:uncharacterized membrane-anchored protein YitT (DUF2179 family)